ncbi:MAG TPA: cell surface protein SprA [Candidatus Kapabacteria bacterium]|nr:cell surface protein SprA [Candidatus Kapabacteria bacterium]
MAYRDQQTYATAGANFFGSETGLDFKQEINVSTTGTIGDKLKINADWGSDRMFQYDNLLNFHYQGYPDEILQEFDAGNVTFNTPSKYIGLQQDLFGLKAITRFGPVYVTTLAAQKKGSRESKSFGGGAGAATEHLINPWDYRKNRFFLDTSFIPRYEAYYSAVPPNQGLGYTAPTKVEVWTSTPYLANSTGTNAPRLAIAYYKLAPQSSGTYTLLRQGAGGGLNDPTSVKSYWIKMDPSRYKVDPTGTLILNQDPDDNTAMAVSYTDPNGNQYGDNSTDLTDSVLVLKLIKPQFTFQNPTWPEWNNIIKSTYYIGGVNFDPSTFSGRIYLQAPGGHQVEYLARPSTKNNAGPLLKAISVTGLDRYNNSTVGERTPDGLIDFNSQFGAPGSNDYIIDDSTGTIVFPYLQPFGSAMENYIVSQRKYDKTYNDTDFYLPEIYNTEQEKLLLTETKLVSIDVKYTGGVSSTLQLGAFNLVEGSVRVTIGGNQLVEGTDFRVDYNSGTVTILNPSLLNTGQINVEYDVHDIFTNATKNILAMRAEVPLFDELGHAKGAIATTLMNYSMSLPTLKTRQGEEPLSNWVWGADGSYNFDAPYLTDAMNALPMFDLKGPSSLDIKLDGALSMPNPNTDKSPMPVDNGASIAYLDDFEGGLNEFPLYLNYGRWVPASQPADSELMANYPPGNNPDSAYWTNPINQLKGRTAWFPPTTLPGGGYPPLQSIKPNEQTTTGQQATTMDYYFDPTHPGIYNPTPSVLGTPDNWGGMMQYAPGLNVAATNTDAIQFYVKIDNIDPADQANATLTFDLGQISDDIIPDKKLETEDKAQNGRYESGEDVGLDGLTTAEEQAKWTNGVIDQSDPSNDNYGTDFLHINGQDGNENDYYSGLTPDHEDLDGTGSVNLTNGYYEYQIALNNLGSGPYTIGGNPSQGWYQLRIPLADYNRIVGTQDSSFSNINYYRIWTKGYTKPMQVELFEFMMVGSQWSRGTIGLNQLNPIADQSLKIGYVNIWDNGLTGYYPPPGAATTLVPSATTYLPGNEQSLLMHLDKVEDTGRREATRIFPRPNDLFNYTSMAIWAHGDSATLPASALRALHTISDTGQRVWVYMRFGSDQYDYYEYRMPLVGGWQNMHVDFATLTALKASRPAGKNVWTQTDPNNQFATYTVVGGPTLTDAPFFVLGVQNETGPLLTTDVWWDELRLLGANDKMGLAWNGAAKLQLSDFGNITGSIVDESADFHRVDERFNTSRSTTFDWNVIGQFAMDKMLPKSMQTMQSKFPLTISHAENILTPEYIVNTDESLAGAIAAVNAAPDSIYTPAQKQHIVDSLNSNNQTLDVKNSIGSADIALRFPGTFFLIPALINRMDFGFGYTEEYLRSPQFQYDYNWAWTVTGRYSLPPLPQLGIEPFKWWGNKTPIIGPYADWKINLLPSRVDFAIAATRARDHSITQLSTLTLPPEGSDSLATLAVLNSRVPLVNRIFTATRGMQITWKPFEGGMLSPSFDYALDVSSNLVPLETNAQFNTPVSYDANGNPVYNYDSVYLFQRSFSDIAHDIFLKNGALARLGTDYAANQRVHMSTLPRLPGLFGLETLVRPVFDYQVNYKWLNAQTNLQNAKQGAWNNAITTGLEFNVRKLGEMIFGKAAEPEGMQRGFRGRPGENGVGITPEELPGRGFEERGSPAPNPREQPRNQVERGEHMRPQAQPNPLGEPSYITDTLHTPSSFIGPVLIDTTKIHIAGVGTEGINDREFVVDTTIAPEVPPVLVVTPPPEESEQPPTPPITVQDVLRTVIEKPLFDWNGTRFNFTQTNSSLNNALAGSGSGISNFLAKGIFTPEDDQNGPSRAYQLGLITDPSGRLLFHWQNHFPFLWYSVRPGLRAADPYGGSVDVVDAFNQANNFELSTSRPLWAGASISLDWKLSFGYAEQDALNIESNGFPNPLYTVKSGDVSRTFLSIPSIPFLPGSMQTGILNVGAKYAQMVGDAERALGIQTNVDTARFVLPTEQHNKIEQNAFMQGFETLPWFSAAIQEFLPRVNWSFNWTGLEKFPLFSFADHASVRDAYNGTYRRSFQQNPGDTLDLTNLQTIVYGFQPLIGFDMGWDKLWNGRLTTSLNYSTQTQWAADYSSARITQQLSTTFGITANYSRQGLVIPFLKLNLKNEFTASFTLSETISASSYYNFWTISPNNPNGISNGGLTKTTIEPRIGYNMSQQLTIEMFYHYERTTPAASGLISPPTRLIEAGLDIHLKIQ